ncbi:MAG: HAD-IC family P-type ATPase [Alphaproteobacteria bacterium]|nr:HAD-IC family P-type ATPase [Alphaproteobacteria bacterium]
MPAWTSLPPPHTLDPCEAVAALSSRRQGLTAQEAAQRLKIAGPNRLPEAPPKSLIAIILHQFTGPFIYLLLGAAALSFALGEGADAFFILIVLCLNAAIGGAQEWRAERDAHGLKALVVRSTPVRRDGRISLIESAALVPGDIVELERGMRVPADMRLLSGQNLTIDESLLTGESQPVEKDAQATIAAKASLADRRNMIFAGSAIASGRAEALVVATGARTEIGQIAGAIVRGSDAAPPLIQRMEAFTRMLAAAIGGIILLIVALETMRGAPVVEVMLIAVALAVSAIPEGLPVAMTIALSISVDRMARRRVLVRNLAAVEGLGSCTVIASDKTGTLTLNELTVREVWLPGVGRVDASDPRVAGAARAARPAIEGELGPAGTRDGAVGDTVDIAMLAWAADHGVAGEDHALIARIPYEPERRYAAAILQRPDGTRWAIVKGAPETVIAMGDGEAMEAAAAAMAMAKDALRVIALAEGPVDGDGEEALGNLHLVALAGLIDPPRPDASTSVRAAAEAGVDVRMVTGDHPATGLALARMIGLADGDDEAVTGAALGEAEGDAPRFAALVRKAKVFARIEPLQKKAIVEALMAEGEFVAVTGDGVNDAAALKAANIGVAMGKSGTDVAREASDLILLDDRFASILAAIEEGRVAYDNLRKVIWLSLSTGAAEILIFLLSAVFALPAPLSAVQLLWLNLVTNGIQDVALAFEKGEPGRLKYPPRRPDEPIIDRTMLHQSIIAGATMGLIAFGFYAWVEDAGWPPMLASSALLWLLVCLENAQVINCRSETRSVFVIPVSANPLVVGGVIATQLLQIAASYTPGLNGMLGLTPLPLETWATMLALALPLVAVVEMGKLARSLTLRR